MSKKKIVVPKEMMKAVETVVEGELSCGGNGKTVAIVSTKTALRWLSENPIVPTVEQLRVLRYATADADWQTDFSQRCINLMEEWQRQMFDAPEPEVSPIVAKVALALQGCTLTPGEADAVVDEVSRVAHGWNHPGKGYR